MDAECKAIEKKMQSEVDQFKSIQKGEWLMNFFFSIELQPKILPHVFNGQMICILDWFDTEMCGRIKNVKKFKFSLFQECINCIEFIEWLKINLFIIRFQ